MQKLVPVRNFIATFFLLKYRLWFCAFIFILTPYAYAEISKDEPPKIGNFALPDSQQPGAFLSFGQNIVDKGQTQLYLFGDDFAGYNQHYVDAIPGIVYGLTDSLTVFLNIPYAVSYQQDSSHSSGLRDISIQLEYVFYSKTSKCHLDTATVVATTSFPTGSSSKDPPTGFGSQAFFLGATFSRMFSDWFGFVSPGIWATTSHNGTKFGNYYFYQFGVGKNVCYATSKYILDFMLELDGTWYEKNRIQGITDPDSGGNVIYLTPSLWFSTQHLILQAGVGYAIQQNWNGDQPKNTYLIAFNLGWTF